MSTTMTSEDPTKYDLGGPIGKPLEVTNGDEPVVIHPPTHVCICADGSPESYEGPAPWCDVHGQPSIAYDRGFEDGKSEAVETAKVAGVTEENRDRAARYIYRSRAPMGESVDEWERMAKTSTRKQTYLRAADEIAKLYMGWDK